MAFDESNGTGTYMPVVPANYGGGFGGDGGWWFILLFLAMGGGLWGNNFGGGAGGMNGIYPWLNQADAINSGFGDVQNTLFSGFSGVTAAVNGAQNALTQQLYTNQIAELQGMNGLQSQLAQCCCENRLATANLQSVIQTEACADRAAVGDALNVLRTDLNAGIQSIKDQMCQDTITRLTTENNQLRDNATRANIENYIQNALTAQTQYFLGLYPPAAAARTASSTTTG